MSEDEKIKYIISTHAIEEFKASDEALKMCREMGNGNIDMNTALRHILEYHGITKGM